MIAARQSLWHKVKSPLANVRYLKIAILTIRGMQYFESEFAMSEWQFINKNDSMKTFSILPTCIACSRNISESGILDTASTGVENPKYLFDGKTSTYFQAYGRYDASQCSSSPCWFVVDLGDETLDLTVYSRYRWYTANDTASQPTINPTGWALYASEDNVNWILLDYVENQDPTNANYSLAYTSEPLTVKREAQSGYDLSVIVDTEYIENDIAYSLSADNGQEILYSPTARSWTLDGVLFDVSETVVMHNVQQIAYSGYNLDIRHYVQVGNSGYVIENLDGERSGTYGIGIDTCIIFGCIACLEADTLITMSDGSKKKVKDIRVGDKVMSIDPCSLELVEDEVVFCNGEADKTFTEKDIWNFEDGTVLETVHPHEIFNVRLGKMAYLADFIVGEDFARNIDGEEVLLVGHEKVEGEFHHATLFTKKYNNYFATGLLAGNRHSLKWGREGNGRGDL